MAVVLIDNEVPSGPAGRLWKNVEGDIFFLAEVATSLYQAINLETGGFLRSPRNPVDAVAGLEKFSGTVKVID